MHHAIKPPRDMDAKLETAVGLVTVIQAVDDDKSSDAGARAGMGNPVIKTRQPRPRKRALLVFLVAVLVLGLIATVIAVPVIVASARNRRHRSAAADDPSYHVWTKAPKRVVNDFPDPGLVHFNGTWYAYGTNARRNNKTVPHVPVATSTDFRTWIRLPGHDALPTTGDWEAQVNHWAPDVIQRVSQRRLSYIVCRC